MGHIPVRNEWAMHTLDHWLDIARTPDAPGPVRVAAMAYGAVTGNGHVPRTDTDLTEALEIVNTRTGELFSPSLASVKRWRRDAVRYGLLDAGTWGRCLVLPAGVSTNLKVKGSPHVACVICRNRTRQQGARVQDLHRPAA